MVARTNKKKLPVTLLSGFLGSGKTTLLEHILKNKDNLKCAVIVNDMAPLNIDGAVIGKGANILQREEKLVQMQNGCICCTLHEDLLEEVAKLADEGRFDYLIIESSGISEPMQVAETFTMKSSENGPSLLEISFLDTCVTVVDCFNFLPLFDTAAFIGQKFENVEEGDERTVTELLIDQIEFANVILLNKTDLVSKQVLGQITGIIGKLNPKAKLLPTKHSKVDLRSILNTASFDFEEASMSPGWLLSMKETHVPETEEYGIGSFVYRARRPFHPQRLNDLIVDPFFLLEEPNNQDDEKWEDICDEELEDDVNGDGSDGDDQEDEKSEGDLEGPVVIDPEDATIRLANKQKGPFKNLIRSKGFIWLATRPQNMGEWNQAGLMLTVGNGGNWFSEIPKEMWPESEEVVKAIMQDFDAVVGDKRQEIVFIGQFKDKARESKAIIKALDDCLCTKEEMVQVEAIKFDDWADPFEYWPTIENDSSSKQ